MKRTFLQSLALYATVIFTLVMILFPVYWLLVTALSTGRFHLEGYQSPRHMLRSAGGAALMGTGGVMAFGCSIGQGLTGLSTLSLASRSILISGSKKPPAILCRRQRHTCLWLTSES